MIRSLSITTRHLVRRANDESSCACHHTQSDKILSHIDMGVRYGIWANDMGDDSIDMVITHIDMGYLSL